MTIERNDITGLVLAGGRGSRMGGVDKGLQPYQGRALAAHALARLRPQVGALLLNANRNPEAYAAFGVPVLADALPDYPGPLAGMLAGLQACGTRWLASVPCDTPHFPPDLVARLAAAASASGAPLAMAASRGADGTPRGEPVFLLIDTRLRDSLAAFLAGGERKIDRWTASQGCVGVAFDDERAFFNVNTLAELGQLEQRGAEALAREFWRLMAGNDFAAVAAVLAEDFVLDWPQSGERIRGAANFAEMNRRYPAHGPWRFEVHRLVGDGSQAASEVSVTDGVLQARALSFFQAEGGRIRRIVEYWPEPFEPAAWRADLVESMP